MNHALTKKKKQKKQSDLSDCDFLSRLDTILIFVQTSVINLAYGNCAFLVKIAILFLTDISLSTLIQNVLKTL